MIQFRPHHFLCTLGFQGKGYSARFIQNYQNIVNQLNQEPNTFIQVTCKLDSICGACGHQINNQICQSQALVEKLDRAHQSILKLHENQMITWASAKERIKTHMTVEKFHIACAGCQWKDLGICETALKNLQTS